MQLEDLRLFLIVTSGGTLTEAAREVELPKSSASRSIARLEKEVGMALLYRTNRKIALTEAGQRLLEYAIQIVEQWQEAGAALDELRKTPTGVLKVAAPVNPGQFLIAPLIRPFLERYAGIRLSLTLTSDKIDPITSGMDIVIRTGDLEDSRLMAKRLGVTRLGLFASPDWLKTHGSPLSPRSLPAHTLLDIAGSSGKWKISSKSQSMELTVTPRAWVNDTTTIKTILVSGFGLGWLPTYMCREELKDGRLVRVLDDWTRGAREFHALFVRHKMISPKVRAFIDFIAQNLVVPE
jgi:DNA-binding transcriptional LysR family regulator